MKLIFKEIDDLKAIKELRQLGKQLKIKDYDKIKPSDLVKQVGEKINFLELNK